MTDSPVTLDDFEFRDFEVPEHFPFGGSQMASVKKLIGGKRIVDAMGLDPRPIEWSGRFDGADALDRAQILLGKLEAGLPVPLVWGGLAFTVLIVGFSPDCEKVYEIPYSITCEVISNDSQPAQPGEGPSLDQMMSGDAATAEALGAQIGDAPLSGLISNVTTAVASVGNFASAARGALAGVLQPIAAVQARVTGLIGAAEAATGQASAIGGVLPGLYPPTLAAGLVGQASAMARSASLYGLQDVMGRMSKNLAAVGQSGAQVVAAGGSLYRLAEDAYGDVSAWTTIARANGLQDPELTGLMTLTVPPKSDGAGGVLDL